jgi:periplasmic protein TonB
MDENVTPPPDTSTTDSWARSLADVHLDHLLVAQVETPWYLSLVRNVRDTIRPPKLPPLEVTSKPVAVKDIWGEYRYGKQASVSSMLIHIGFVAVLIALGTNKTVQNAVKQTVTLVAPDISPWTPDMKPKPQKMQGGGGGGDRSPIPASLGRAPRVAPRQFVPPSATPPQTAKLIMEPTIVAQSDVKLPSVNLPMWGDPLGKSGPPSNGPGSGGGIGTGSGGGIGPGRGPGFGPGEGGGIGGGVYRIGGGVSSPIPIYRVEPEYSEEARKAKFQGTVVLSIVIDERGIPTNFKVIRPLGLGLDEKAIEAVQKWRFKPGYRDGKAVAVLATVEVNFRLL